MENYVSSISDKWEYLYLIESPVDTNECIHVKLDTLGNAGWELVGLTFFDIISDNTRGIWFKYIFKRRKHNIPEEIENKYKDDIELLQKQIIELKAQIDSLEQKR